MIVSRDSARPVFLASPPLIKWVSLALLESTCRRLTRCDHLFTLIGLASGRAVAWQEEEQEEVIDHKIVAPPDG